MEVKKADYVAVPATENVAPTPGPAPFDHCSANGQPRRRRCRLVKFTMIGAAIGLLAFSKFGYFTNDKGMSAHQSPAFDFQHSAAQFGYPSQFAGAEQMKEMDDFFGELMLSVGPHHRPHSAPECCAQPNGPHPFMHDGGEDRKDDDKPGHHRHHKHHGDKHDDDEKVKHRNRRPRHRHHPEAKFHDTAVEDDHPRKPKGCPCFAPPPPPPGADYPFPPPPEDGNEPSHPPPPGKQPDDDRHPKFPPPPPSFCPAEVELNATSSIFKFSPEDFGRAAVYIGGGFADSGNVVFTKSVSEDVDAITVNATILHGSDFIRDKVNIGAFDHEGQYVVELKHDKPPRSHFPFPHPPPPPFHKTPGDLCLKYIVNIAFPANVDVFEDFEFRAKQAMVSGDKTISGVTFEKFTAGVGRGYLNFDGLHAKTAKLGVLSGHIRGTYETSEALSAGVVRGSAEFKAVPLDGAVKISAAVGKGVNAVEIPADAYEGDFNVHSSHEGTPTVSAPNPADVHVVKYKHNLKAGYYKEKDTGSVVVVHTKHGDSKLVFA